ncbi:MAG TPA: hypothetical protein VF454_01660 [Gemmatimonadales bacterium]
MSKKRWLQSISAFSLCMVPVGFALWIKGLATEEWAASEAMIELAWKVIPTALLVAIVTGVMAARQPDLAGKRDRVGLLLAGIAILLGIGIVVLLLNLDIR